MFFEDAILIAFINTVISEIIIILVVQKPKDYWLWVFGVFVVNALTHPLAIYFLHVHNINYFLVEFGVFLVEAILYYFLFNLSVKRAVVISLAVNIFSILTGILLRILLQ